LRESFFRWDEGKGYSFYAEAVNRPGLRRFAEDYLLQTTAAGRPSALDADTLSP